MILPQLLSLSGKASSGDRMAAKQARGLNSAARMDNLWRWNGELVGAGRPDRRDAGGPRSTQRAFARYFPPDRGELSRHRRAGGLAQHLTPDHDAALARFGAQRDVGPGAARPHLCAAHLGRPAADRDGAALLRGRADGNRRPRRSRPARDGGQGRGRRQVHGGGAERSLGHAVRPHARGRRGAGRQIERAAQAHRVRAARARARAGHPGGGGRPGREPHHRRSASGCRYPR